jgi:hypothetical protein
MTISSAHGKVAPDRMIERAVGSVWSITGGIVPASGVQSLTGVVVVDEGSVTTGGGGAASSVVDGARVERGAEVPEEHAVNATAQASTTVRRLMICTFGEP